MTSTKFVQSHSSASPLLSRVSSEITDICIAICIIPNTTNIGVVHSNIFITIVSGFPIIAPAITINNIHGIVHNIDITAITIIFTIKFVIGFVADIVTVTGGSVSGGAATEQADKGE